MNDSRHALRRKSLDCAYVKGKDRYNKGELKSTKRPYSDVVKEGELPPSRADERGLTQQEA